MECQEAREHYSEFLDCCLGDKDRVFEEHLSVCPICQREVDKMRCIIDTLKCLPEVDVSPDFLVKVNQRIDSKQNRLAGWWKSIIDAGRLPQAIAVAATMAFVVLISFHLSETPEAPIAEISPRSQPTSPLSPVALSSPTERIAPLDVIPRHARTMDITGLPATFGNPLTERVSATPRAIRHTGSMDIPGMMEIGSIPLPTPRQVPYVDKVIMLKAIDTSEAADQVRKVVASFSGLHLDYSENVIFTLVAIEKVDPLLQAMETMGSTEVISGPIDRGLPTVLFQVIVIPER